MANQNADQWVCATAWQNQIEAQQNPWQIHRFESCTEPKVNNHIFVELAPNVEHR